MFQHNLHTFGDRPYDRNFYGRKSAVLQETCAHQ